MRPLRPGLAKAFEPRYQKARFLVVGGWNTVVGYLVFIGVYVWLGATLGQVGSVVLAYCFALPHSYLTQRTLVFLSKGRVWPEFLRFCASNTLIFASNIVFLPVFTALSGLDPVVSQGIFVILSTIASFLAHRYYSFARAKP